MSRQLNSPRGFYHLGVLLSTGDIFDVNISKSIECFQKCSQITKCYVEKFQFLDERNIIKEFYFPISSNKYVYASHNCLGLIYLIDFNDINHALEHIKKAAFAGYPFAHNNFGILNQFYLNDIDMASRMFRRSSEANFPLAEFNLGYINEKENNIKESIQFYKKASEHENEPLLFNIKRYYDKRLDVSKTFIICLINLKLAEYYFSHSLFEESKMYFSRIFSHLSINTELFKYKFECSIDNEEPVNVFSRIVNNLLVIIHIRTKHYDEFR